MGWDVFISHASEDKPAVAVPLKAALEQLGISVWIDIDQIKLGDSFRSKIDGGLQLCRFGVVILSPRFFEKPWAKAELDALFAMEMSASGQRRLLPIVCEMSFAELTQQSPMMAGRRAISWSDGVAAVTKAIADVVLAAPNASPTLKPLPLIHRVATTDRLVLFLQKDGRLAYAETVDVESRADTLEVSIKCVDSTDTALVEDFSRRKSDLVAVAFGTTATVGRVTEAILKRSGAEQIGILRFRKEHVQSNTMEMSVNGISADQIAVMRAERILLNAHPKRDKANNTFEFVNDSLLDHFITGSDGFVNVAESPIPKLFRQFSKQPELFVSLARLAASLFLCLSSSVESVLHLDMALEGSLLKVDFSGRRAKKYTNVAPQVISIKGELDF